MTEGRGRVERNQNLTIGGARVSSFPSVNLSGSE